MNLKMGHVRSKARSLGQIVEKRCVCFRDRIFGLIPTKLGQSFCLDDILYMDLKMDLVFDLEGQTLDH